MRVVIISLVPQIFVFVTPLKIVPDVFIYFLIYLDTWNKREFPRLPCLPQKEKKIDLIDRI